MVEPETWLFDNEHYAWSYGNDMAQRAVTGNTWVVPLTRDMRKKETPNE